ncbi:hypothetical protein HPB50_010593 [Hyalomma asiaticum]|uniref:Uncharacterized protein n=1 Tax=Hyalomma asiaticum TaxID=266040 RepID=A0ACB7RZW9_HYAAI|nr:hypothetical protein HPB50_010593 [Hyalomma asiaticum]
MSGAETGGKIEVSAPVRLKDNHNEVDIVPAVDKECKGTSQEVCSSSKAAFRSDEHLDPNDICDTADIFETTLVAEAGLNIASSADRCTSTGISRPSLSSTVASGDTLDLGVETDDTLTAEAQSPLASAKSTEHCLPMQLPTDVPKSGSVTSGDTLDLGVESDDMFVAEVHSPVASEKSANCCQPTSQTANASTHDVLGQQCADMLGCVLPQNFSVPSADTKSLAVDSPAHPLLASTSSEDELHIPEDLDMREKLKLIRAQQERHFRSLHEPEDQHAHVNNTVPSDIKGLEPQLPIAKAPEVKNKAPFMSEDPDENMDNENPEWEAVRSLTTDEERYRAVQVVWHNIRIPDPHKELSTFNYRRHTLSMKHAKNPPSSKPKRRKRKASHNSQHEHTKPVKRQRFDTDIIDLKLKELKRKREKDVTKAQKTFRDDIRELHMTLMSTSQEMHASHDHGHSSKHHRRAHTTPWDFRYYLSQEQRICEEFKANEKSIQSNYMAKEHKLLSARNEVRCVDDFYAGLRDKDPRLLSDKQVREHLKREEMLGYFKVVYKTPKE